jgi:hypothetical protein
VWLPYSFSISSTLTACRACTLLGGVSVLLAGVPFLFYVYGKKYVDDLSIIANSLIGLAG